KRPRRRPQAAAPYEESARPAPAHEALHSLRRLFRRKRRPEQFSVTCPAPKPESKALTLSTTRVERPPAAQLFQRHSPTSSMNSASETAWVVERATALGFDLCGVV